MDTHLCFLVKAIPHNSKCRYGERGAADAKPKAQIILDAAKVSAASGGNSEPKQGQRSQSARGFCPRSTMRVPQPDIIEHFGNADAVPQLPERCLSRKAGIVRCCLKYIFSARHTGRCKHRPLQTIYRFAANIYASPRRGEGTPPYHLFYCWLPTIKCSVGNGPNFSESPQTMHPKTEIWRTPGTVKTVPYKSFFNLRPFL